LKKNEKRSTIFSDSIRFSLILTAILLSLSNLFSVAMNLFSEKEAKPVSVEERNMPTVILDAGHGGMDSGAVSIHGDEEKHINLSVTKKLGCFLENAGIRVIYTRTEDVAVESEESYSSRKTRDLMGRVELAKKYPDALFISIHMNTLPAEQYKGLQIFYADRNDANRALAQVIQNTVASMLQPDNKRTVKDAQGKIFILDRIDQPALLVECGFLSNAEEASLLKDETYQAKLAFVLSRPILDFLAER